MRSNLNTKNGVQKTKLNELSALFSEQLGSIALWLGGIDAAARPHHALVVLRQINGRRGVDRSAASGTSGVVLVRFGGGGTILRERQFGGSGRGGGGGGR